MATKTKKNNQVNVSVEKPAYVQWRIDLFDKWFLEKELEVKAKERVPIKISLLDSRVLDGTSWETTPLDIAKLIRKSLVDEAVIAKVDGELWDLARPLEKNCVLQILTFDNDEGKAVFWHSSAHVLGEACELHYGCHLCLGPPIEDGFYYEMGTEKVISQSDYPTLENLAGKAIKEKQPFQRLFLSKEQLLEMFKDNKYKVHFINDKVDKDGSTVYRCGPLIDLCRGPHVPHTGRIKAFKVTKNSASYFLGDANNDSLQRVYGISFPEAKMLKEWQTFMEEAEKRDHRRIGTAQELFFFHELSPGSAFWLPHGTRVYNALMDMQKSEYRKRGFTEVITPNMYNSKLWETSGHWANYQEDMFIFDIEKQKFGLKPMNCPGHCLMFANRERSYRELPIRLADFGVLHRNEASGALSGLTRVRRFQQDDAHIFCTVEQLPVEIENALGFIKHIYGIFGFEFQLKLSTRPEKFLGSIETWDRAESILEDSLNKFGKGWELNPQDGAFYGPKIDIVISDALRRKHQCATLQLDFQLPERFELKYRSEDVENPFKRPVMIHRAILGSVERCTAILTEHFAGKWPFWLSPRQIVIVPVAEPFFAYADKIRQLFWDNGFWIDADLSDLTLQKKIRNAELSQYNFIFTVGQSELDNDSVNVRNRDAAIKGKAPDVNVKDMLQRLLKLKNEKNISQVHVTSDIVSSATVEEKQNVDIKNVKVKFDVHSIEGLNVLDDYLSNFAYVEGFAPSLADVAVFNAFKTAPSTEKFPYTARWYHHIESFGSKKNSFPSVVVSESLGTKKVTSENEIEVQVKPKIVEEKKEIAKKEIAKEEEEEDIDLFGSDDEEDEEAEKIKLQRLKEYQEKKNLSDFFLEPKPAAKSMVILDVKPWDDETDMVALESEVRAIEIEGLIWGSSKLVYYCLVAVGYGIKKLQITCVVEDDKVGIDDLSEKITEIEDFVQSVDVAAFNKL
ncbi:threonyl-tRNA synthetase [Nowakowskiella sp. JEL0078]|nr:threonyl-tRNA synthetase [Nowakowskiella sp. JEL0078]